TLPVFVICVVCAGLYTATVFNDEKLLNSANKGMHNGDYQLAEKIYRELLVKDAHVNDARLGLSTVQLKQRNLQGAYDNAARVILLDPLSARAHALLGSAILIGGDFRNSYEEFRTSLSLNEADAMAVAGLAMIDFYENRLELAMRGLRRRSE